MNNLLSTIAAGLCDGLDGFKYLKSRKLMQIIIPGGWLGIEISLHKTSSPEVKKLAAAALVRIDELEDLYAPYLVFLTPMSPMSPADTKIHPTLGKNCDVLLSKANQELSHGFHVDEESISCFINDYVQAIRDDILPWLEKYSEVDAIYDGLCDPDPMRWLTSNILIRYPVLLAILTKRGDYKGFESIASEFLAYCDKSHALVYKPYAEAITSGLRKTFLGQSRITPT